jgi:hypothetical protein
MDDTHKLDNILCSLLHTNHLKSQRVNDGTTVIEVLLGVCDNVAAAHPQMLFMEFFDSPYCKQESVKIFFQIDSVFCHVV